MQVLSDPLSREGLQTHFQNRENCRMSVLFFSKFIYTQFGLNLACPTRTSVAALCWVLFVIASDCQRSQEIARDRQRLPVIASDRQ